MGKTSVNPRRKIKFKPQAVNVRHEKHFKVVGHRAINPKISLKIEPLPEVHEEMTATVINSNKSQVSQ
jgi:hypothetical protein